ncbi:signal peptidase II [Marispirochaeta aestuarii]|uniref:signal peptidase II n=1 Tax=Marispirochaeta aestuarii TaxID=1963862 RepID=UPI0029C618FA|nr:signal peptidase II [Marispirochaeta aestuarii]
MNTTAAGRPEKSKNPNLYLPLVLTAVIILADQLTKLLIVANIPYHTVGFAWGGDFLWILHTRNLGVAFSIGYGLPAAVRGVVFVLLPLAVLAGVLVYYFRTNELLVLQRWCIAAIIGGGLGNQIDRIFRPQGVVDFVSVKFYGIMGLERWPAFNVADASIVVGGILLALSFLLHGREKTGKEEQMKNEVENRE